MSDIRELSLSEIELVSGGNANGQDAGERSNYGRSTNYGAQANGFQPNYAAGMAGANMYNDLSSNCGLAMLGGVAGLAGSAASRSVTGAVSSITGIIAGCKSDSKSASKSGAPFR